MPTEAPIYSLTVKASTNLAKQRFVDTTGTYATAAGRTLGVSRVDAKSGDNIAVHTLGTALVTAGGVIAKGDAVEVAADGKAIKQTAGTKVGVALTPAAAADETVEVYLVPNA